MRYIVIVYISIKYRVIMKFTQKGTDSVLCTWKTRFTVSIVAWQIYWIINPIIVLDKKLNKTYSQVKFLYFSSPQTVIFKHFQGKWPIFKADWKIKHFSRQHSNSINFQGSWKPCELNPSFNLCYFVPYLHDVCSDSNRVLKWMLLKYKKA